MNNFSQAGIQGGLVCIEFDDVLSNRCVLQHGTARDTCRLFVGRGDVFILLDRSSAVRLADLILRWVDDGTLKDVK